MTDDEPKTDLMFVATDPTPRPERRRFDERYVSAAQADLDRVALQRTMERITALENWTSGVSDLLERLGASILRVDSLRNHLAKWFDET